MTITSFQFIITAILLFANGFAEKVNRSLGLIEEAYSEYGDGLVVTNSLGKDSCVV